MGTDAPDDFREPGNVTAGTARDSWPEQMQWRLNNTLGLITKSNALYGTACRDTTEVETVWSKGEGSRRQWG